MPLLDTTQYKDLLGTFISDLILQVLSFVAEQERRNIRTRQAEGIAAAKARGVRFGPRPKPLPHNFQDCLIEWKAHHISAREAARRLGTTHNTFLKWAQKTL